MPWIEYVENNKLLTKPPQCGPIHTHTGLPSQDSTLRKNFAVGKKSKPNPRHYGMPQRPESIGAPSPALASAARVHDVRVHSLELERRQRERVAGLERRLATARGEAALREAALQEQVAALEDDRARLLDMVAVHAAAVKRSVAQRSTCTVCAAAGTLEAFQLFFIYICTSTMVGFAPSSIADQTNPFPPGMASPLRTAEKAQREVDDLRKRSADLEAQL
jgi:hypothetical protein